MRGNKKGNTNGAGRKPGRPTIRTTVLIDERVKQLYEHDKTLCLSRDINRLLKRKFNIKDR